MNVVTIDFDIIMEPSIIFYNNLVPKVKWQDLDKNALARLFCADLIHYQRLTSWLTNLFTKLEADQISFVMSHDVVYDLLPDEKVHIINIDHHHDYGYRDDKAEEKVTCANWVKKAVEANKIYDYLWVNNETSEFPPEERGIKLNTQILKEFDLYDLQVDKLIICLSPEWIPFHIRPLFDLWIELYQQYYNVTTQIITRDKEE